MIHDWNDHMEDTEQVPNKCVFQELEGVKRSKVAYMYLTGVFCVSLAQFLAGRA